jgi:hypothetical protein
MTAQPTYKVVGDKKVWDITEQFRRAASGMFSSAFVNWIDSGALFSYRIEKE